MELGDGMHQSQAKSRAALLPGAGVIHPEEEFKDPLSQLFRDTGALILHRNAKPLCAALRTDGYGTSFRAVFYRVFHQIKNCPVEQFPVPVQETGFPRGLKGNVPL